MDVENIQFIKIFIMVSHTVPASSIHTRAMLQLSNTADCENCLINCCNEYPGSCLIFCDLEVTAN